MAAARRVLSYRDYLNIYRHLIDGGSFWSSHKVINISNNTLLKLHREDGKLKALVTKAERYKNDSSKNLTYTEPSRHAGPACEI